MTATFLIQAMMIGVLITAPTVLAILICSRGNAADRAEIRRLTAENERFEARDKATTVHVVNIYADHNAEIADLKAQHEADLERLSAALNDEFMRGIEWERNAPKRAAQNARWVAQMEAEHKALAEAWR